MKHLRVEVDTSNERDQGTHGHLYRLDPDLDVVRLEWEDDEGRRRTLEVKARDGGVAIQASHFLWVRPQAANAAEFVIRDF